MDFLQLKYFKTTAELEHISKASQTLLVSQPALSITIKKLEEELGCPLFDRVGKNIKLNSNGKIVLKYADEIFRCVSDMKRELSEISGGERGEVRLSIVASTGWLPQIVTGFKKLYPDIDIIVNQKEYSSSDNGADLYIYSSTRPPKDGETLLLKEECLLAVPEEHRLSELLFPLTDEEIGGLKDDSFFVMENRRPLWNITYGICRRAGFVPHVALECDSRDTIFSLVKAGLGVAFVPELTWKSSYEGQGIAVKPLEEPASRYIILKISEGFMPACVKKLRDFIIGFYNSKLYK